MIVDDEEALRTGLRTYLELEEYEVIIAADAREAMTFDLQTVDLILLDIMMDHLSGFEFAKILRSDPKTKSVPIIFLTARNDANDIVSGLKLGADDYITKPFSIKILLARIESVLRRTKQQQPQQGIICCRDSLTCTVDGQNIKLPRKEFELLALLSENPGKVFSREELLNRIWPEQVIVVDRTVDVHITRLRGKIAPYGNFIVTRSGYGYGWKI